MRSWTRGCTGSRSTRCAAGGTRGGDACAVRIAWPPAPASRWSPPLGQLSHKYRETFTLRAIEGLSLQEASGRLGVPVSTISYRTRKAEQLLCDALGLSSEAR